MILVNLLLTDHDQTFLVIKKESEFPMKENILTKIPDVDYRELAPEVNYNEFDKVVRSRRSVRVFTDKPVPESVLENAFRHALLAPNSSNLQPWHFIWIKEPERKRKVVQACLNQSAARTAPELVVVIARKKSWKLIQSEMLHYLKENKAPKGAIAYYEKIVPLAYGQGFLGLFGLIKRIIIFFRGLYKATPRGPKSDSDMRVWAHKSTALACQNFMLSIRAQGYDTCPMEGFDEKKILACLTEEVDAGSEVCMVISVGERANNGIYGPQIRMAKENFISIL